MFGRNNYGRKIKKYFKKFIYAKLLYGKSGNWFNGIDMTGEVLENYMTEEFNDNFTYGELYDLFKNQMNKADLESLLESMGHDFVDLDELSEEEKEKYY